MGGNLISYGLQMVVLYPNCEVYAI